MEQGIALLGGGRYHDALQQFGLALRQMPTAAEPRIGLSQACQGLGDGWAAAAWLSDACRVAPQRPELWLELARLLSTQQREAELEPLLRTAVAANPDNVQLHQMLAELYLQRKMFAPALPVFTHLHDLQSDDPVVSLHFGFCLEQVGDAQKAAALYRRAIAQRADFFEAHVNLAGVLWRIEDFQGALTHASIAMQLQPAHPYAVRILGTALLNLNRLDEAETHLRRALELLPGFPLAIVDLSFALLLGGRLPEGWPLYAQRWLDTDRMKRPPFFQPALEWRGPAQQPLRGKRLAVYAEQGLGDVIQFIRYVRLLQADGATVHCVVQPDLVALIEASFEGVTCLRRFHADYHAALLDLPMHYRTTLASIPSPEPYLRVPPAAVEAWAQRMPPAEGRLRVGIAWSGSRVQVNNINRAMRLSDLLPLLNMPQLQCFSLQKADAGACTDVDLEPAQLIDLTAQWKDFSDSAAMIRNLDLVITVDTAVAHLAGALGKKAWVMLPPNADWRWLLDREDSPWYVSMRLFRRGFGEARAKQVARVAEAVLSLVRTA
jgi:tetratricopeptide (TPR) repeat protein